MKRVELWMQELFVETVINDIDDLLKLILEGKKFIVKDEYMPGDEITNPVEEKNNTVNIVYTDENHPVIISNNLLIDNAINSDFYKEHEKEILKAKKQLRLSKDNIIIERNEYNKEFLKDVLESNATTIIIEEFKPTDEELDLIFYSKKDVISNCNGVYKKYGINAMIGDYSMDNLQNGVIDINFDLSKKEIEYMKYIGGNTKINFRIDGEKGQEYNLNTVSRINTVIETLQKLNKNNTVNIGMNDLKDRDFLINNMDYSIKNYQNININYSVQEPFPFTQLELIDDLLKELTSDLKGKDLSNMEKYLFLYNKVKQYKEYNETKGDLLESREINHILFNDYIVCVGFSSLLKELLRLENIESFKYSTVVDTSYDNGYTTEEKILTKDEHMRLLVNIKDDKYDVDHYFVADPTWDNNMKLDLYSHALEPMSSMREDKRLFEFNDIDAFLDVDNFEDYNEKLNHVIKRKMKNHESLSELDSVAIAYEEVSDLIMKTLKELDYELYNDNRDKYRLAKEIKTLDNFENFLSSIGERIIEKTNKALLPITFKKLLYNVKKSQINDFTKKELDELLILKEKSDTESYPHRGR